MFLFIWTASAFAHKRVDKRPKEMIKVPRPINFLFGSFHPSGMLSYPVLIGQILWLLFTVAYTLVVFEQITQQEAYQWLKWPAVILGFLVIVISLIRKA